MGYGLDERGSIPGRGKIFLPEKTTEVHFDSGKNRVHLFAKYSEIFTAILLAVNFTYKDRVVRDFI
jgi:hypothetical protein